VIDPDAQRDEEAELDRYQCALLEALADGASPSDVQARLLAREDLHAFHGYLAALEPRALEVGMHLVRLWGERVIDVGPGQMRGAQFLGPRQPLTLGALPIPRPNPGQVRIRVLASGVCGTDVHLVDGTFPCPHPLVAGHEPIGVIDALGEGAQIDLPGLTIGARVGVPWVQRGCGACPACDHGLLHRCMRPFTWMHSGGGHAEWMIAEASGCVPIPDELPSELAAPLFCAGFTVMSGLRRASRTPERVGVLGIGGLGHLAVQVAKAEGHQVIAITQNASKRSEILGWGASEVVVVKEHAGRELMAAGGVDVLLATSNDLLQTEAALEGLLPEGRLVTMGLASDGRRDLTVEHRRMMGRGLSVIGGKQGPRSDLHDLLKYAATGAVRPQIEPYPLSHLARAMQRLRERRVRYRAVLLP
jgi:D-arabinose 1-dehydrogenase-like Zn-dependent alcohol dehydrogenase